VDAGADDARGSADDAGAWPHTPVLSHETIELLALAPGHVVVDGTLGTAGHAVLIRERIRPDGVLIGFDRDAHALEIARRRLDAVRSGGTPDGPRVELVHASFRHLGRELDRLGIAEVDRVLFDLGVSSLQLDSPGRGMSFRFDDPLDMRFDTSSGPTAFDLVRSASEHELAVWFREYGEERYAKRIARALVWAREQNALPRTTGELAELVVRAVPQPARRQRKRLHPATRVFQALRIAVNDELGALEAGLEEALWRLREGGRLAVISFHSLEDRRVKTFMRSRMQPLTKKPVGAGDEERARNPRSRSAKLRVAAVKAVASDPKANFREVAQ